MDDSLVPPAGEDERRLDDFPEAADLAALRDVLVGPEQRRLEALQRRLEDPEARAQDIGEVLPHVLLQHAQDPHFAKALIPPLEKAMTASVRRDPKPMADALFPVMGPAIRKAVSSGLSGMVESLNRTLEHSLSMRSFQWRLEARRTGRSFGEIVLLKTLVYRVEQVFLIDRKTSLLLQHVQHGEESVQDADMVSSMLTAIRDFVGDSFKVKDGDALETLKVGDLSIWIESGPFALVAAVVRGSAPSEYKRTLQDAIESLHLQFGDVLETFNGDASALADARPTLEGCLETRYRPEERKSRGRGAWWVFGLTALALVIWAGFAYRAHTRWTRYVDLLRAEPGLVVVDTTSARGRFVVEGLRDPLARDPRTLLPQTGLADDDVEGRWAPYHSLDPSLVLTRAQAVLHPPAGAALTLENGVLSSTGLAPLAWVNDAARLAPLLPGVTTFDVARALAPSIRETITRIEATPVLFSKGAAQPVASQREVIDTLLGDLGQLEDLAASSGLRFRIDVVGHTDADGPPESNLPLSRSRADVIAARILATARPHLAVAAAGVGSAEPAVTGQSEADNQRNRRVAIKVVPLGGA